MSKKYHLFEVFGIELEYMVVAKKNLAIAPIVDALFFKKNGTLTSDIDNGAIAWSNELVAHVVELKTNGPSPNLNDLGDQFYKNILEINSILHNLDAQLLPTAMHPFMQPAKDTQLWQHSYSEVYELYNRIFNCQGHGWSNVQSTHINLPFYNDNEFEKLHAAIRLILPIIPGLCASSPIVENSLTNCKDNRLEFYKNNQKEIPELAGLVIPENVFTKKQYVKTIFEPIKKAIKPFDTHHILDHHFLNSRGAIARFDRNAIEIRLVDIQECPKADLAICTLIIEVIKYITQEKTSKLNTQKKWVKEPLFAILNDAIKNGENAKITNLPYLALFGIEQEISAQELWQHLYAQVKTNIDTKHHQSIEIILTQGTLATRITNALKDDCSKSNITKTYATLAACLATNTQFTS